MTQENKRINHHYFVDGVFYTKEECEKTLAEKWRNSDSKEIYRHVHEYSVDKDAVLDPWTSLLEEATEICHDNLYEPKSPMLFDLINRDKLKLYIASQHSKAERSNLLSHSPYYIPNGEKPKYMLIEETNDYLRFITRNDKESTSLEGYLKEYILPGGFEFTEHECDILRRIHYVSVKADYKVWGSVAGEVGTCEIDVDLQTMDVETFRNNVYKLEMEIVFEMHTKKHEYVTLHFNFKHYNPEANQL